MARFDNILSDYGPSLDTEMLVSMRSFCHAQASITGVSVVTTSS